MVEDLLGMLRPLLGDAADYLVLREIREVGDDTSVSEWSSSRREVLASHIVSHILRDAYSPSRLQVARSRLYSIFNLTEDQSAELVSWRG